MVGGRKMSTNIDYKEEIEKSQKAFNDFKNGLGFLTNSVKDAASAMSKLSDFNFENYILSMSEKRLLNLIKIENNYNYIIDDFFNNLIRVEAGNYCDCCELKGSFCEGSRCDEGVLYWFDTLSRKQKRDVVINALGKNYFYNLSLKLKLRLLNY